MNNIRKFTALQIFAKLPETAFIQQYRLLYRHLLPTYREVLRRKRLETPKPNIRSEFLEWNYNAELYAFGKRLGEDFDGLLLRRALTEYSYVMKHSQEQSNVGIESSESDFPNNRDMILEGAEIIDNYLTCYLRHALPRLPEEGIQSIKNHLMSENTLAEVSSSIGTSEIILSKEQPPEKSNLANVLKALIYALKEGNSLDRACLFIRDFIITQLAENDINDFWEIPDPIGAVKQICENEKCGEPEPRIAGHEAITTIEAVYRVGLYVDKKLIGLGAGETVKIAHETAACDVLRRLFGTSEKDFLMPFKLQINPNGKVPPNVKLDDWCEDRVSVCKGKIAAV